ncbi:MAG: hypothetical protein ACLQPH_00860 [Acidimicrobiales bacterium]
MSDQEGKAGIPSEGAAPVAKSLSAAVVEAALRELTSWVYRDPELHLRHPVGHRMDLTDPSSRSGVIHTFIYLKHHGYPFDPVELRAWADANGWASEDAQALGEYAAGVLAGSRYVTVPDPIGESAMNRWRDAAIASNLTARPPASE